MYLNCLYKYKWRAHTIRSKVGSLRSRANESTVAHFASVRDLIKAIKDYVRHYNANPGRFQ
jgi:hypothetical protein